MKTPSFWNHKNILSTLLLPVAAIYETIGTLRRAYARPAILPVPVICIGNLTAGGSGKTPVALHIGGLLKQKNIAAFFLSRGYGGALKGPVLVDSKTHSARDVGDEPLLLAGILPTVVSADRLQGALYAIGKGAQAIVMDDGFQNPSIAKSLSLVVIDGRIGFGNGHLLPAGPLRESPASAFKRAHAVIVLNRTTNVSPLPEGKPVFFARTEPAESTRALKGKKIFAFCGLAYPRKFFDMLSSLGAHVVGSVSFADHYLYKDGDIQKMINEATAQKAVLVTTRKDAVRLSPSMRECVFAADINVEFDNAPALDAVLDFILKPR